MKGEKLKTEDELRRAELKRHIENAATYWGKRFENLKERGYEIRFEIKIADFKREIIEILLSNSALQYIRNCSKIKGKNVDLVSRSIGDVFRKVGKEKEIAKIIGNKVITCGCHGLAYILKILSGFYDKINRKLDKKEKDMERKITGEVATAMLKKGYREDFFCVEVFYHEDQKKYMVLVSAIKRNMFIKKISFLVFPEEEAGEIIKNIF